MSSWYPRLILTALFTILVAMHMLWVTSYGRNRGANISENYLVHALECQILC